MSGTDLNLFFETYCRLVRSDIFRSCVTFDDVQWMLENQRYFSLPVVRCSNCYSIGAALERLEEFFRNFTNERDDALKEIRTELGANLVIWKQQAEAARMARAEAANPDPIPDEEDPMHAKDKPGIFYYSTQPFLAYCINHFFYAGDHYAYVGGKFYPYRKLNPKSSNPMLVYQDTYQPWRDDDDYDKFITGLRMNLRKGVIAKATALGMPPNMRRRLKTICSKVSIDFLHPIVYRVELTTITPQNRLIRDASAGAGSDEYKIVDLKESEFTVLFDDYEVDPALRNILQHDVPAGPQDQQDALDILEGRLTP